jgi:hypothetical protein
MSYTTPDDGPGWPATASARPSPQDGVPAVEPRDGFPLGEPRDGSPGVEPHGGVPLVDQRFGGHPPVLLAAVGGVVTLVIVAIAMVVTSGGGDPEDPAAAGVGVGEAVAPADTSTPANVGTVAPTTTEAGDESGDPGGGDQPSAGADLPEVTIPPEASPPTTIPGSEPNSVPTDIFSGEEAPQWGTLVVDLEEGGYQDFAVHLRDDQELQLLSLADDGIETEISMYAPDGALEGWWAGGEPGVINGLEWYHPDEPLPATGTYVIRAIHTGGSHEPFVLGFFGNP